MSYVALGKYSNEFEDALHYLCVADWSNESFGHVEAPTGYVWRISNNWEEVKPENGEFNSVMEDWFEQNDVEDSEEFRRGLVGHFIIREDSQGFIHLLSFPTEKEMLEEFDRLEVAYSDWDDQGEE